ncbi:cobyrinate a,c-diamide synthase [Bacillus massilinigeriensis]|uniref:cobyrinate a,c-diamide synthase n=1 Tax=Bacillus mediterraneensis TaxID=1805474 RepID=UPI0008F87990|nr:cobyrinate a,c-diamide synthase [Bacillus mediterraneensis]
MRKRLVIAGTGSGVGKTTLTLGLMSALKKRGLIIQGFKCGPDYIDPSYHTAVTGRISRNLDSWMLSEQMVKRTFVHGSCGADISIIEGVMGFYDGKDPLSNEGSTAHISMITGSPVILVVNCASMARSAAAIVKGFQTFDTEVRVAGVIANNVGSTGHYRIVKAAIEQECDIPVLGYFAREKGIEIPERHLGLIPSIERGELDPFFERLGNLAEECIDLDKLIEIAGTAPDLIVEKMRHFEKNVSPSVRIAVAKDAAFNFYYQENLELLESRGAELVYFSPLAGEAVPVDVEGLYLGGGFPEEFARELSGDRKVLQSVKEAVEKGLPTLAECGGFMYLTDSIETTDGAVYQMAGIIPGKIVMGKKLAALGYREIKGEPGNFLLPEGVTARGHEFHYSNFHSDALPSPAYTASGRRGSKSDGFMKANLVAGYIHFHFGSCLESVDNWISKCKEFSCTIR